MENDLFEKAKQAITELFNDTNSSPSEKRNNLEDLIEEIEILIISLQND